MADIFDEAFEDYNDRLNQSIEEFLNDISEMEEDGYSIEEILAVLAAMAVGEYFIEMLGMNGAVNAYSGRLGSILDNLVSFGTITEGQLASLGSIQSQAVAQFTSDMAERVRLLTAQGLSSGQSVRQIRAMINRNPLTQSRNIETFISSGIASYKRSVVGIMSETADPGVLYQYEGPLDSKTRPICRVMLASPNLTKDDIGAQYPGAFTDGGGYNCRHSWIKASENKEMSSTRKRASNDVAQRRESKRWREPVTLQQYYEGK